MLQQTLLDKMVRAATATKNKMARRGPKDINPFVVAYRGDELVALTTVNGGEKTRENILQVILLSATGLDADAVGVAMDTYSNVKDPKNPELAVINPLTNQPWRPGEIHEAVHHHDAIARGWVTEAITLTAVNRAGDIAVRVSPYHYAGKHLVWDEDGAGWSTTQPGLEGDGLFPTLMHEVMLRPSAAQRLPQFPMDRRARDRVIADELARLGHACLLEHP